VITKPSSRDLRRVLRAAAPPLLILGVLFLVGEVSWLDAWTTTFDTSRLVATFLAGFWLVAAVGVAVYRAQRDAHAHQRLRELRDRAQAPGMALVHVQTMVWSSSAGQHAVVVNVASGHRYRLWLPEAHLPIGAFALLAQRERGVVVLGWLDAGTVAAGHRHERRTQQPPADPCANLPTPEQPVEDAAALLVRETEEFLQGHRE